MLFLKRKVNPMPKKCTDFVVELRPQRLADVGRAVGEILHDPRRRGAVPTHLKWEMYQCNDRAICMNILWCAQAMLWLAVCSAKKVRFYSKISSGNNFLASQSFPSLLHVLFNLSVISIIYVILDSNQK